MNSATFASRLFRLGTGITAASLIALASYPVWADATPQETSQSLLERLKVRAPTGEQSKLAAAGIEYLLQRELDKASLVLNSALKLDPTSSYVQLLNGLAYHLMATQGDADKYGLAEQGYKLALQFDKSNWLARYFLGNLYLDQKQFAVAQTIFAEALLYADNDADMLYQLATASYYAGDPTTAAAALGRLDVLAPGQPRVMRAMSIVMAAINKPTEAQTYLDRYRKAESDPRALRRFEERVKGWTRFHSGNPDVIKAQFAPPPSAPGGGFPPGDGTFSDGDNQQPGADNGQAGGGFPPPGAPGGMQPGMGIDVAAGGVSPSADRMVLVDVVILRTEDLVKTRKGINLLNGLTLQFGAMSKENKDTITRDLAAGTLASSQSSTITRSISLKALDYTLNIANANSDSNEVLARPTIAALEGVKSEFFSGSNINAGAVATGSVGGSIQIEKEIGVKLAITPRFLDDDRVRLNVIAERTFLKAPSSDITYSLKIETTKTTVNSQIVMRFGETLILSGLSEKETSKTRDGVPLLQDIPILQYLFSRSDTSAFQRSVLILLTPRRAEYVYRDEAGKGSVIGNKDSAALSELRARYIDWFKPYPNLASVFHHLGSTPLYREFRTGDVTLERWAKEATLTERLHQVVDFLYY